MGLPTTRWGRFKYRRDRYRARAERYKKRGIRYAFVDGDEVKQGRRFPINHGPLQLPADASYEAGDAPSFWSAVVDPFAGERDAFGFDSPPHFRYLPPRPAVWIPGDGHPWRRGDSGVYLKRARSVRASHHNTRESVLGWKAYLYWRKFGSWPEWDPQPLSRY